MKRCALFVGSIIILLIAGSVSAQTLGAVLTPSQEVPACSGSGSGNATVTFDSTRTNINVTITVAGLNSPITGFHIHHAAAGLPGNIVEDLQGLGGQFVNGTMTGTFPIDPAVAADMIKNPSNYYVNVHTQQCPGGGARGQLAIVSGGVVMYAAELRGANETPPNSSAAFGGALVTFDPNNQTLAFEVNQSGVASPTASHIHRGAAGTAGPVIINFATGPSAFQGTRATGSGAITSLQSSSLTAADLTALANPSTASGFYVNYHSTAFPGGEIRGQLAPAQEVDIPAVGHVTNGAGQTFISDVRVFNPSFTKPTTALIEYFPASTNASTNAAASMAINVPARGTAVLNDVVGSGGLNTTGVGAMRITSVDPLIATSRVYVNTTGGSFGQFVDAFPRNAALRRGVLPQVSNTSATTAFRSNVGFFNPNQEPVTVRLEARDAAGNVVGSNTITLAALSQQQLAIGNYFPGVDVTNATNLTLSFDASAGIFVYASEVDNTSGDSFLIPAQPDPGVASNQ